MRRGEKWIEFRRDLIGIEGLRVQSEFAEQIVDALIGFGFHLGSHGMISGLLVAADG